MTRIKICGITNEEDARAAIDYGADALGFIFVPESPRYIPPAVVLQSIAASLPPFVTTVAVVRECWVNAFPFEWRDFRAVQFYAGDCSQAVSGSTACLRAFRVQDAQSLQDIEQVLRGPRPNAILLDTYHKEKLGGSGETFNWELAIEAKQRFGLPVILAGGLTPTTVEEAVAMVRPYAVDVSSGVEAEPGRKDHAKLRAFIQAVRRFDARQGELPPE